MNGDNRVAIVTGGAGGIGLAICRRLAESGWSVLAGDLPGALPGLPEEVAGAELDVSRRESVDAFVAKAADAGRIGAVVNCAGVVRFTPASELDDAAASQVWEVNVAGAARVASAAASRMDEGSVVNIASVTAWIGRLKGASLYGASKSGLQAYTRYLATELAPRIRVNAVAPGYIDVPMSESWRAVSGGEEALIEQVPLGRLGRTDEIADAVEFLTSSRASYITGSTLLVDGGVVAG